MRFLIVQWWELGTVPPLGLSSNWNYFQIYRFSSCQNFQQGKQIISISQIIENVGYKGRILVLKGKPNINIIYANIEIIKITLITKHYSAKS